MPADTSISKLCSNDLIRVNQHIEHALQSTIPLVHEIGTYIIQSGGKRLRPMISILVAKAYHYEGDHHNLLGAIIECLHTAMLLHDDVVDEALQRRGKNTANQQWGNATTILVGDYIYARAFQMILSVNNAEISKTIATTVSEIAEGEVLQLSNTGNYNLTEDTYIEIIKRKTAVLFAATAKSSSILANQPIKHQEDMYKYGEHLGVMFQIIDDILDYQGDPATTGKNIGTDLREGKMTLPLIKTLNDANDEEKQMISQAITAKDSSRSSEIIDLVKNCSAITQCLQEAQKHAMEAKKAINHLSDSPYKTALLQIVDDTLTRNN